MMTIWSKLNDTGLKSEQIAFQIRSHIEAGLLKPGDKLPTQRRLAEHLEITVGTVTRAYALAHQQGLVETRTGSGSYVKSIQARSHYWGEKRPDQQHLGLWQNTAVDMQRAPKLQTLFSSYLDQDDYLEELLDDDFSQSPLQARKTLCQWMLNHGINMQEEHLFFSYGVQHGLNLSIYALDLVGESLLCEAQVYPGLITLAKQLNIRLYPVRLDEDGLCPYDLQTQLEKHHCRAIYLTPTLQNPTTAVMPLTRRQQILELCQQHKVTIIEDDVCGLLPAKRPTSFINLDPDSVIHLNGFSKGALKGLRFGFLHCPASMIESFKSAIRASAWNTSPMLVDLAMQWITRGYADQALKQQRELLQQRAQLLRHILKPFDYHYHDGSLHVWLRLPDMWTSHSFAAQAKLKGVEVADAEHFCINRKSIPNNVRLSLGQVKSNVELETALSIIQELLLSPPETKFELM
ncbi:PLP-dependent aminotransferase family protein [Alginatibacterium sediminis]|uniref:PLP-dependent aminotransferase family protein n=1 Tax=Alginatibacterium sediminis TaxID=2164068 RepID=A0A420E676_9ALTE|nr:PLP-dependent aminotransferase family protein [Alginatibacterium sediminis]RKF13646.1 PLP-dependent aminotransferase family protein [Alginatibacterium sediminis]